MKFFLPLFLGLSLAATNMRAELQKLSAGYVPNLIYAQLFVIAQEGWDKQEGIDLSLVRFPDATMGLDAYIHGEVNVAYFVCPTPLLAASRGVDICVIAAGSTNINELYGKGELAAMAHRTPLAAAIPKFREKFHRPVKFLTFYRGCHPDLCLRYWLSRQSNITPGDYEIVNVVGQSQFLQAIMASDYDAVVFFPPLIQIAVGKLPGLQPLLGSRDLFDNCPAGVLAVSSKLARENPAALKKLVRLQIRATAFIKENPDRAAADVQAYMTPGLISIETLRAATRAALPSFDANPHAIKESTRMLRDFMVKDGLISKPVDLDHFFNTSFYDEVVAESGK